LAGSPHQGTINVTRLSNWLSALAGIIATLVAIKAGLSQLLPDSIQEYFNKQLVAPIIELFATSCDLTGKWTCASAVARITIQVQRKSLL
jgi:hypothetical protein